MSRDRAHERLESALRELPGLEASEGFTEGVLARLGGGERSASHGRRQPAALVWTLAAASILLAVLFVALLPRLRGSASDRPARAGATSPAVRERAAHLRNEHRRLRQDLQALRAVVDENPPVLYLGGDDRVDLVFDFLPTPSGMGVRSRPALASTLADNRR